jgi:hypothetical protein
VSDWHTLGRDLQELPSFGTGIQIGGFAGQIGGFAGQIGSSYPWRTPSACVRYGSVGYHVPKSIEGVAALFCCLSQREGFILHGAGSFLELLGVTTTDTSKARIAILLELHGISDPPLR